MELSSWFKINRDIFNSDIWQDVATFRLFFYLIGKASHRDGFKYRGLILNEGQYVCSYRKLADELSYVEGRGYKKYSLHTIKRSVNKLIDAERVNVKGTEYGTLFTVVNYAKYQRLTSIENNTGNALNVKPETLTERTRNVNGTNPEQYQELKNLRTKELKNYNTTTDTHAKKNPAITFYKNNFDLKSDYINQELSDWINILGNDLVIKALKRSLDRGVANWGYAKSILQSWKDKNIKTVKQAKAEKLNFFDNKRKSHNQKFDSKERHDNEIIPEWFNDRNKTKKENELNSDEEKEIRKLLEKHV